MATAAASTKGSVYVFNVYSQDLTLSLNGADAMGTGNIPGWTAGTKTTRKAPTLLL